MKPPRVLIVAGSDSGGGAGIQADIKTVTMLGGFPTTSITAITAQNTLGVSAVMPVPAELVLAQIEAVLCDIGADAVKIGMIGSAETAEAVAERLSLLRHPRVRGDDEGGIPIVFDPVMVATSGSLLADSPTIAAFDRLARVSTLVTPNAPELSALTGLAVDDAARLEAAALALARRTGTEVLAKGGHLDGDMLTDLLVTPEGAVTRWNSQRIDTRNTHGTGCTLSSAIATHLGRGRPLDESIECARSFVRIAMLAAPGFGQGHGPMGHEAAAYGEMNLNQVTLPARDYRASVDFYRTLGLTQIVDSPGRYARFECPGGATLSIHVEDGGKPGDAMICLESADLDSWVERLRSLGIAFETSLEDQRWGWREAHLRDPAGNRLILYRAGENRRFPPWRLKDQ
ncbi:MAG: phosphomethylpyrimidine kinase [Alphaproteobacteria bacterium]|nr:phosphomethylpyrimidine kinase [Alphaproteobacteria bacterium]